MKKHVVGIILAASLVAGVGAGFVINSLTSKSPSTDAKVADPTASPSPAAPVDPAMPESSFQQQGVEVKNPILVTNRDGTATLSATLINHTEKRLKLMYAWGGKPDNYNGPIMLLYGDRTPEPIKPGKSLSIGGVNDNYRVRLRNETLRTEMRLSLGFGLNGPRVTFKAPVVTRSAAYAEVADNGPNTEIKVHDAKIVVVPGQEKAFVGGRIRSTIYDVAFNMPTAVDQNGKRLAFRHQTATGGSYGVVAKPDEGTPFGGPPFLAVEGDADYFLAEDVTVGETVMVTIQFPSGDVVTPFKVVQARADGTI